MSVVDVAWQIGSKRREVWVGRRSEFDFCWWSYLSSLFTTLTKGSSRS